MVYCCGNIFLTHIRPIENHFVHVHPFITSVLTLSNRYVSHQLPPPSLSEAMPQEKRWTPRGSGKALVFSWGVCNWWQSTYDVVFRIKPQDITTFLQCSVCHDSTDRKMDFVACSCTWLVNSFVEILNKTHIGYLKSIITIICAIFLKCQPYLAPFYIFCTTVTTGRLKRKTQYIIAPIQDMLPWLREQ